MALRKILTEGDEQLLKHSRKVEKFDDRLHTLIDDMRETLENSGGVGLAAPQVGILRRVVVLLDVNKEPEEMVELVNPEVIEQKGSERVVEGCLSVPACTATSPPTWPGSARRTATATGSSARARASLPSASAMRPSIWTDICSPKRWRSMWTSRSCSAKTGKRASRNEACVYGHAGFRRAEPACIARRGA